jgi:YegS/Rv2252/BmrU family lipid kinase
MKTVVIFNPGAGQRDARRELEKALELLTKRGWEVTQRETQGKGDALIYAQEAISSGYEAVIVAGGDGTVNEVVNGLVGSDLALGVLPLGTGNVWAREIGMPFATPLHPPHLLAGAQALTEGLICAADLGQAGEKTFLLWTGVGFDAQIVEKLNPRLKRYLGPLAYIFSGLSLALEPLATPVTLTIDGKEISRKALFIEISNVRLYAAILRLAPEACLDDGLLEITIFKGEGILALIRHFFKMLICRHLRDPQVERYKGKKIRLTAPSPLPVHIDGDYLGTTPLECTVLPQALRVLIPEVKSDLFQRTPER